MKTKATQITLFASIVRRLAVAILLLAIVALAGCSPDITAATDGTTEASTDTTAPSQPDYAGKKIIWSIPTMPSMNGQQLWRKD